MSARRAVVLELLVSTRAGGGPQHVLTLSRGLRSLGWQPIAAGPRDGPLFDRFREVAIDTVALRTDRLEPITLVRLLRLARAREVRLIHSHGKGAGVYGRLVARMLGLPAVHTFHGIHFERYGGVVRAGYLALERWLARRTAAIVHVSRAQQEEARRLRLGAAARSHVVVNGVDGVRLQADALAPDEARRRLGLEPGALVVGSVARLDEVKRLDLLIRASARLGHLKPVVALIGAGPEEAALRALARTLDGGADVRFAGEIQKAARLLRAFDVYVAPSRKEGMPLAVLEAMTLGLAVVASAIPAHQEVLGPDSVGLVAGEADALAQALSRLLPDPSCRSRLGADNRARAERLFSAERMVEAIDRIYRAVLGL